MKVAWDIFIKVSQEEKLLNPIKLMFPLQDCSRPPSGGRQASQSSQGPLAPFKVFFLSFGTFMAFNDLLLCPDWQSGHT